jgi:allantoicase
MSRDTLPGDFFRRLSPKKAALHRVLLDAHPAWIRGVEARRRMREEHNLSVPDKPGAISIHQAYYTRWYSKEFSRDLIQARWDPEDSNHAQIRLGDKYADELREWFDKQDADSETDS